MAIVQYRKYWESADKIRYLVAPVPEETYAVEFTKETNAMAVSHENATGIADELLGALIRRQLAHDPGMKKVTQWPESGEFQA